MIMMNQQCVLMLNQSMQVIQKEEQEDQQLRGTFGAQWPIPPSATLNASYKENLNSYQQKLQAAGAQDNQTKQRFEMSRQQLSLLTKTKMELVAAMPEGQANNQIINMPPAVAIKNALDSYEASNAKKNQLLKECQDNLTGLNMIEDLQLANTGSKSKDQVFQEHRQVFEDYIKRADSEKMLIQQANLVVTNGWPAFENLKKSVGMDPTRQ